jgi:hypothetical protein
MKKQAFKVFTTLSLFVTLAAASVYAQANGKAIPVNIPFKFLVGDTTLPAGEYIVEPVSSEPVKYEYKVRHHNEGHFTVDLVPIAEAPKGSTLLIRSADGHRHASVLTNSAQNGAIPAKAKLVFHRYGDRYFLAQVWTAGDQVGRNLVKSGVELEVAKNGSKRQTVSLMGH